MSAVPEDSLSQPTAAEIKIAELQNRANEAMKRIEGFGAEITNIDHTRSMFLIGWLHDNILTEAQRQDFAIAWLEDLNRQIAVMEATAHDQKLAHIRRKLAGGPSGLVVPGNLRRPGS